MRFVRIGPVPALGAGMARMGGFWAGLSRRERVLLGAMLALAAGVVLVYGVVKPLQAARAQALADIRTYETLNARVRAAGRLDQARTVMRTGAPEQVVTDSASGFGLAVNAEAVPGGVKATIAEGDYDSLVSWLADLGRTSTLTVRRVDILRGTAPGRVSATVEFAS